MTALAGATALVTGGAGTIPLSAVTAIVENDQPLPEIPSAARRPADDAIGVAPEGAPTEGSAGDS